MSEPALKSVAEEKQRPDVVAIMNRIRDTVRRDIDAHRDRQPAFQPRPVDFEGSTHKAGDLLQSEDLRYLNVNYAFGPRLNLDIITSHRPGIIGKSIVFVKRRILGVLWQMLKVYFQVEREYQSKLVRFLNDVASYIDIRDAANFWELVRKIDVDITRVLERVERLSDEQSATLRTTQRELTADLNQVLRNLDTLKNDRAADRDRLKTLESVSSGLEGIVARLSEKPIAGGPAPSAADQSYLLLENRFRGSQSEIKERVSIYPAVFAGATKPVLEIGAGRGELQLLFKERGVPAFGVDLDGAMVAAAKSAGADVRLENGLKTLEEAAPQSLGGLIAIQVVEHLTQPAISTLIRLTREKVATGGKIVFETINPKSVQALSSNYFRDPTHVFPMHPDTLAYAMTLAGLKVLEVRNLSPVPDAAKLQAIPEGEHLTPRLADTLTILNRNIRQLNDLLYGDQDFCIIAEV